MWTRGYGISETGKMLKRLRRLNLFWLLGLSANPSSNRGASSAKRIHSKPPWLAILMVSAFLTTVVFGTYLTPQDPFGMDLEKALMPPFWEEGGDFSYLLGTDAVGRGILSRLIFGARETLLVTLFAIVLTCLIGVVTGMISGYFGGMADVIIMRISDIFLSVPPIMMGILLAVIMEPGLLTLVLAIAMGAWTQYARLVRGEVLSLKEKSYVRLARVGGAGNLRIMVSHMLPNVANTLIILVTLEVGRVTILAATLSFLGLGMQPPSASWGLMLAEGRKYITYAWWQVTFPGIAILITVLGFNLTGDWLRDVLDPKQKLR